VEPLVVGRGQVSLNLRLSPLKDAQDVAQGVTLVLDDLTESKLQQAQLGAVRRYLPPAMVDNIKTIDELELTGVEREISVLFCDVRGFTTFSESLPPESLMEVINRYLSVSSEAINLHEGIIDKYMGDAVVGLYNTQLNPQEDHAIRAVRSALAMLNDVADLHETLPDNQRLYYGIGVHTGVATLGNVGSPRRKEFTVIGDSLQIAKFVQENASNDVIISGDTYDLVNSVFVCESIQPRRLKEDGTGKVPKMYIVRGVR
jgi:class 3 adenylate cyclase